jgi:hypothetical protein
MSLIGSIGHNLFHLFQTVGGGSANNNTQITGAQPTGSQPAGATSSTSATTAADILQGAGHHHHHRHGGGSSETSGAGGSSQSGGIFGQIQSAVLNALQSAQASSQNGGAPTDPDLAVQTAIASVLTGKGISNAPGTDPDGDGDTDAPGQTDSDGQTSGKNFIQTLEQYGITPERFRQDFLTAIKNLYGGQEGAAGSTASNLTAQSIPPGSLVDETA